MTKLMRGTCRECGREYSLRADGTIRAHLPKRKLRKLLPGQCKGAFQPPRHNRCW